MACNAPSAAGVCEPEACSTTACAGIDSPLACPWAFRLLSSASSCSMRFCIASSCFCTAGDIGWSASLGGGGDKVLCPCAAIGIESNVVTSTRRDSVRECRARNSAICCSRCANIRRPTAASRVPTSPGLRTVRGFFDLRTGREHPIRKMTKNVTLMLLIAKNKTFINAFHARGRACLSAIRLEHSARKCRLRSS